jgi:hypothetical protein
MKVIQIGILQRNSVNKILYLHFCLNLTTKNQHHFTVTMETLEFTFSRSSTMESSEFITSGTIIDCTVKISFI